MVIVIQIALKSSQNKKDLNDVTAAPFLFLFFAAGRREKDTKNGAAVTSLRTFVHCNNFSKVKHIFHCETIVPDMESFRISSKLRLFHVIQRKMLPEHF